MASFAPFGNRFSGAVGEDPNDWFGKGEVLPNELVNEFFVSNPFNGGGMPPGFFGNDEDVKFLSVENESFGETLNPDDVELEPNCLGGDGEEVGSFFLF